MPTEKEDIKKWLKINNLTREWLAAQCKVKSRRSIDNWFAKDGVIPDKAMVIIESLMEKNEGCDELGMEISAEYLDRILKNNGMDRIDLAQKLGITRSTINSWISRGAMPKRYVAEFKKLFEKNETVQIYEHPFVNGMTLVSVPFTDAQYKEITNAAKILGISVEQFIIDSVDEAIEEDETVFHEKKASRAAEESEVYQSAIIDGVAGKCGGIA